VSSINRIGAHETPKAARFQSFASRRALKNRGLKFRCARYSLRMTRDEAWQLLTEFTASESLRKHALAVEAAMRNYAPRFGGDVAQWGLAGLIHDFDYERYPEPPAHTREGARILRERGVDEEVIGAMLAHARWNWDEFPLDRPIRKALFAVDELCGFITAVSYVRPEKLRGMEPSSVKKKLKNKNFAASVSRDDITQGAELLGLPIDEHIANVIAALQTVAKELGIE
jgi:putative nucleotidyltransferase with HDIG domain